MTAIGVLLLAYLMTAAMLAFVVVGDWRRERRVAEQVKRDVFGISDDPPKTGGEERR